MVFDSAITTINIRLISCQPLEIVAKQEAVLACPIRGQVERKPVMPVRAQIVLVVSSLKTDPRAGDVARCWLQI